MRQKEELLMFFCSLVGCMLLFLPTLDAGEIPQSIQYQGRFLDAATNRPVEGVVTKQMTFTIRKVGVSGIPDAPVFSHTASNVSIRDGVFNVEIPVPSNVVFDEPFGIEVVVQGSGGGNLGFQKFRTVPYAITAKNALQLGGLNADQYSLSSHTHTTAGGKTFTIDGSGSGLLPSDPQLLIKNGDGSEVFRVSAAGDITQVNKIEATGTIETLGSLRVKKSTLEDVFSADNSGEVFVARDLDLGGNATVGSLVVTGLATLASVKVQNILTFGPLAEIQATLDSGINVIGASHTLESHSTSTFFFQLESLVNGSVLSATSPLHTHSLSAGQITSNAIADNSIEGRHIKDATIKNIDIASDAAISDTKLATISTAGKITTVALPVEVVLENESNTFGAGFGTGAETLSTLNEFDGLKAKTMQIISTSSSSLVNFIDIQDKDANFSWLLAADGTLKLNRKTSGSEETRIQISSAGGTTTIKLKNVQFQGDSDLISGAVIENATLQGVDISNATLDSTKIQDGAITTVKIADGAITDVKLADNAVTRTKIQDGEITTAKIDTGAITEAKIADDAITKDKIGPGAVTAAKIADDTIDTTLLKNDSVTSSKIATGAVLTANLADGAITKDKIASGAIGNDNLADNVIKDRDEPASINLSNTTTPHLSLSSTGQTPLFLKMFSSATSLSGPALLITNSNASQELSLNLDGSISMKSTNLSAVVTLEPEVLAAMMGISSGSGSGCPLNSGYSLVNPLSNAANIGNGFCISHKVTAGDAQSFNAALKTCNEDDAGLCSLNELRQACVAGKITDSVETMSLDLTHDGTDIRYITFNRLVGASCGNTNEFTISSQTLPSLTKYACCINP
jgi:hypothetical protein